jgi:hypothetical protein
MRVIPISRRFYSKQTGSNKIARAKTGQEWGV